MSACCGTGDAGCGVRQAGTGQWFRFGLAGLVAAQSMIFGLAVNLSPPTGAPRFWIHVLLAVSAVVVFALVGMPLAREAWQALKKGRVCFEQLFMAGILGAFGASLVNTLTDEGHVYYEVVAVLLAIYTFGRLIGERRREAALSAAEMLGREFEMCEVLLPDGRLERRKAEEVMPGDVVCVAAGGAVPVDGRVVTGAAFVREAALTGEPLPVVKREGDRVLAGSYSLDAPLRVRAEAAGTNRSLDRLLEAVREAQNRPSRLQKEADRLTAWFLPVVLSVSVLTFVLWTWKSGWITGMFNALAVLLVACPCSMGIATPVAIWGAMSALARRGLLVQDSDAVEGLARARMVVFDKTGTLGDEEPVLEDFVTAEGVDREELLGQVAALERGSEHPLAKAFRNISTTRVPSVVENLPGAGLAGQVDGHSLAVGNEGIFSGQPGEEQALEKLRRQIKGGTAAGSKLVYVMRDGVPAGLAVLRERLRDSAKEAMEGLEMLDVACEVMTGDSAENAARHGLVHVLAGLLPEDKKRLVEERRAMGPVVFVGDGVNDAPAMAAADVSIAMHSGSELARRTASASLAGGNLRVVPEAIARCRNALAAVRRNMIFAAVYNVIGIALAAAGMLHPVAAALLMLVSSFTVTWAAVRSAGTEEEDLTNAGWAPPRVKKTRFRSEVRPSAFPWRYVVAGVLGLAVLLQGPVLGMMGGFTFGAGMGMTVLFLVAGVAVAWMIGSRACGPQGEMLTGMFAVGGLAMLAGWWVDAGWGPAVRDGICLCGCPDSTLGQGIFGRFNWMMAGMLAASVPMVFFEKSIRPRWVCGVVSMLGMVIGMELAMGAMTLIPVEQQPQVHFFATYSASIIGMCVGMLVACGGVRRFLRSR